MRREISINVDATTFHPNPVPSDLLRLPGLKHISVSWPLLHLAIWTRSPLAPPGLQLSDYWAWLRYARAYKRTTDLRLNDEWQQVDPHQKTILSDELGVGFTTYALSEYARYRRFCNTLFVARTASPIPITIGPARGPRRRRAPDYIAENSSGNFVAVECKGRQTVPSSLRAALRSGVAQKQNVTRHSPIVCLGLVGGLFIPQSSSTSSGFIEFHDPPPEDLIRVFESLTKDEIRRSVLRGALSNQLFLAGAVRASREIASNRDDAQLTPAAQDEVRQLAQRQTVYSTSSIPTWTDDGFSASVSASISAEVIQLLVAPEPLNKMLSRTSNEWSHRDDDKGQFAAITSPDGFTYELTTVIAEG